MSHAIHVEWTPRLAEFVEKLKAERSAEFATRFEPFNVKNSSPEDGKDEEKGVSYALLKEMYEWEKKEVGKSTLYLHELLKGSSFFSPAPPVVEKDPAFVARLEKMRHQVENRLYAKMVENVSNDRLKRVEEENRADMKTGMDTAKLAGNLLMSVVAVFVATYFVFHTAYNNTILSISASTIAAIGIFMVEVILIVLRGTKLDNIVAKSREEFDHGISSPFPPAAPSLIEAEREKIENARKQRIEARKQAKLAISAPPTQNSSNSNEERDEEEEVAPLLSAEVDTNSAPKPIKFFNHNEPVSTSTSTKHVEEISKHRLTHEDILAASSGGPVLDE